MDEIKKIRKALMKLHEAKKTGTIYALQELSDWLKYDLDEVSYLLDDLENELTPDYPDQQQILNHEHVQAVERGVA